MIPREILKKIRQIEIRTNRIVTESGGGARLCEPQHSRMAGCQNYFESAQSNEAAAGRRPALRCRTLASCAHPRIPTGFRPKAQGCEARATLGQRPQSIFNRNAVAALPFVFAARGACLNPVGVVSHLNSFTQGSSSPFRLGSTLGWRTQSRWDCRIQAAPQLFVGAFNPKTGKLNREIHQPREKGKSIPSVWFRSRISRGSRLKIC